MEDQLTLSPVAYYEGPLTEKFGLPRQSGLVPEIEGTLSLHRRIGCGKRSAVWKAFPICG